MLKKVLWLSVLVCCLLAVSTAVCLSGSTEPKAPYILSQDVKQWLKDGRTDIVFVDVREPEEYQAGHIPSAINIPYAQAESRLGEFQPDQTYIVYCIHSSWRAPYTANLLMDKGVANIYVLEGGVSAWHAGGQVIIPIGQNTEGVIAPYPQDLVKNLIHPTDATYIEKKVLTREQLARYNGQDGRPAYVAISGVVYDLTQSRLWRGGAHDPSHGDVTAGRDLTEEIKDSPHGDKYLKKYPVVGRLID